MSKKKEAPVKAKKSKSDAPKSGTLKVSKSIKIMAAMAALRGGNRRELIRLLGAAEDIYKRNGRLVFGG